MLIRYELKKAIELINHTDYKIADIASKVGFNNTNYFIKIFKKLKNVTPGQYQDKGAT